MSPLSLQRVHVGLRAVGQPALRPQHLVQPIGALAAENADRQVERHVVRMVAPDADVPDAHLGLHGVRLVDDDHAARRDRAAAMNVSAGTVAPLPVAEHLLDRRRTPLPRSTSPTTARMALFGTKLRWWNATRSSRVMAASVSGVPLCGMPYGWKP